jgi:hypothetical protein
VEVILHLKENIEKNQRDRAQKDKQKADQDWGQDLQRLSERFCWVLKDFLFCLHRSSMKAADNLLRCHASETQHYIAMRE